jgi:hypothetical protein
MKKGEIYHKLNYTACMIRHTIIELPVMLLRYIVLYINIYKPILSLNIYQHGLQSVVLSRRTLYAVL